MTWLLIPMQQTIKCMTTGGKNRNCEKGSSVIFYKWVWVAEKLNCIFFFLLKARPMLTLIILLKALRQQTSLLSGILFIFASQRWDGLAQIALIGTDRSCLFLWEWQRIKERIDTTSPPALVLKYDILCKIGSCHCLQKLRIVSEKIKVEASNKIKVLTIHLWSLVSVECHTTNIFCNCTFKCLVAFWLHCIL